VLLEVLVLALEKVTCVCNCELLEDVELPAVKNCALPDRLDVLILELDELLENKAFGVKTELLELDELLEAAKEIVVFNALEPFEVLELDELNTT
jgi:hypothetical protein